MDTEKKHRPEPWVLDDDSPYFTVSDSNGKYIIAGEMDGWMIPFATDDGNVNAARVVACVNACAGMADPAAEIAALRESLADAESRIEQLTDQLRASVDREHELGRRLT